MRKELSQDKNLQAYIIGLALGDGNLSNPNGRAVRLRVTCDKKYPELVLHVQQSIQRMLPKNKISITDRLGCVDVSCYSNAWEHILAWKAYDGSKFVQNVCIPGWVKKKRSYIVECLRGLFQTDGCIYNDRGYLMVNFVSYIPSLAKDVCSALQKIGYIPNLQKLQMPNGKIKHTIRISRNAEEFIKDINLWKK